MKSGSCDRVGMPSRIACFNLHTVPAIYTPQVSKFIYCAFIILTDSRLMRHGGQLIVVVLQVSVLSGKSENAQVMLVVWYACDFAWFSSAVITHRHTRESTLTMNLFIVNKSYWVLRRDRKRWVKAETMTEWGCGVVFWWWRSWIKLISINVFFFFIIIYLCNYYSFWFKFLFSIYYALRYRSSCNRVLHHSFFFFSLKCVEISLFQTDLDSYIKSCCSSATVLYVLLPFSYLVYEISSHWNNTPK